ncbi:MAG: phosphoribosyl-AMP cyclohydrolase [Planctomycetota bacterium]
MKMVSALTAVAGLAVLSGCQTVSHGGSARTGHSVTEADVIAAQQTWGEGIVAISKVHTDGGNYTARATQHINDLYAYQLGDVMFKPTLAADDQFRESFDEALSYFIGREGTEDGGFAIKGWTNVRWQNNAVYTDGDSAMAMGNYWFTGPDGNEIKVEYTFGYIVDENEELRINLHHSSLPYSAG